MWFAAGTLLMLAGIVTGCGAEGPEQRWDYETYPGQDSVPFSPIEAADTAKATEARQTIETLLELLADPRSVYRSARDADRKLLNQICFAALYLTRDQHGIETARSEHAATAAPLLERIKFRRTRNGAVPEDNAAHENGFHKPMGSDNPSCTL